MAVSQIRFSPLASGHSYAPSGDNIVIVDYGMIRIAAIIAGLVLIACPAVWLAATTIPVPKYRTHGLADFLFLGQTLLAIYGSVLLGIAVHWVHARRSGGCVKHCHR